MPSTITNWFHLAVVYIGLENTAANYLLNWISRRAVLGPEDVTARRVEFCQPNLEN